MDRAATLPCPMMVVGVVMDAAPPNQSEATSAAFMEAPPRKMAFAYFLGHAPKGFLPLLNGGNLPIVFCFLFLYLAFAGGGVFIDVPVKR